MKKLCISFLIFMLIPVLCLAQGKYVTNTIYSEDYSEFNIGDNIEIDTSIVKIKTDVKTGGYSDIFSIPSDSHGNFYRLGAGTECTSGNNQNLRLIPAASISEGRLVFEGDIYISEAYDGTDMVIRMYNGSDNKRLYLTMADSDATRADVESGRYKITKNKWHSLKLEMITGSDGVLITYDGYGPYSASLERDASVVYNSYSHVYIYPMFNNSKTGYMGLDNLKLTQYVAQGEIESVNSGADLPFDATSVSFKMDKLPKNLKAEYIDVLKDGVSVTQASSYTTNSSDGYEIEAVLSNKLESGTDYTLRIRSDAYLSDSEQTKAHISAFDITKSFRTKMMPFEMTAPTIRRAGAKLVSFDSYINNDTASDEHVTLIAVSYKEDGSFKRICSIKSVSAVAQKAGGQSITIDNIDISATDEIKLFSINGWNNKKPIFGKSWVYDKNALLSAN